MAEKPQNHVAASAFSAHAPHEIPPTQELCIVTHAIYKQSLVGPSTLLWQSARTGKSGLHVEPSEAFYLLLPRLFFLLLSCILPPGPTLVPPQHTQASW